MKSRYYLLLIIVFTLSSCIKSYIFTKPDGTSYKTYYVTMANDSHGKSNKTTLKLKVFNKNDINKYYYNLDSSVIQELTVRDLTTQFNEFDYTLLSLWYPCGGTYMYEIFQYMDLVDTLEKVSLNPHKIAFAFASLTYDYHVIDMILKGYDYHYQSYLVPYQKYSNKVLLKTINFIKELCPVCYHEHKDYVAHYTVLLLDSYGEVIKMINYEVNKETGITEMKDFEKIKKELIDLIKA